MVLWRMLANPPPPGPATPEQQQALDAELRRAVSAIVQWTQALTLLCAACQRDDRTAVAAHIARMRLLEAEAASARAQLLLWQVGTLPPPPDSSSE